MSTTDAQSAFRAAAAERILVFDGGYGTAIQKFGLQEADYRGNLDLPMDQKGNNDLLCLTRPDIIKGIHAAYFDNGADMVETNTFSSTRIAMADIAARTGFSSAASFSRAFSRSFGRAPSALRKD